MKKNIILTIVSVVLCIGLLCACGDKAVQEPETTIEETLQSETQLETTEEVIEVVEEESDIEEETTTEEETTEEETTEETDEIAINWDDIDELETPEVMYVKQSLRVRKGPGKEYEQVGTLKLNDELNVIGTSKSTPWKEIKYKDEIAFVHGDFLSPDKVEIEVAVQAPAAPAVQQPVAPAPVAVAPQPDIAAPAGVLFIGDSRTCQMKSATGGAGCTWICEYGTKYDWFESTAIPEADKIVGKGTKVVVCMGVNDPGSINNYASLVNRKAGDWNARGAKVYYVSLNPVSTPYEDKTPSIDNFNASMPGLLSGVYWIDTASIVKQGGYLLEDGIHYDAAGNANIFSLIYGSLR